MWPRPSRSPAVSRGQVHLPWCAGITRPNAAQDIICFPCSKGAFLPRIQSGAHRDHAKLLCSWVASSMYQCMRWSFPTYRSLYFHLLNFIRLLLACFSSLSRALWMSSWSWGLSASLVSSANLLRVHSAQLSRQYKKMLNGAWTQYWYLSITSSHWPPTRDCITDHPLWAQMFSQFSIYLTIHSSRSCNNSFPMRTLQEMVSKASLKYRWTICTASFD